jgi:hypothetical protein
MKYRLAYAIASVAEWFDVRFFAHGERFEHLPFIWRLPTCEWSARLHWWAAKQCCPDMSTEGCARCNEDVANRLKKYGVYEHEEEGNS